MEKKSNRNTSKEKRKENKKFPYKIGGKNKMCEKMPGHCYSDEEKKKLKKKGWSNKQIEFTENSIVENKIKELI